MGKRKDLNHCIELARIAEKYFFDYVRDCAKIADPTKSNMEEDNSHATPETVMYYREMFLSSRNILRNVSNAYYEQYNITKEHPEIERIIHTSI